MRESVEIGVCYDETIGCVFLQNCKRGAGYGAQIEDAETFA